MVKDKKDQSETLHHGDFIFSPVHCVPGGTRGYHGPSSGFKMGGNGSDRFHILNVDPIEMTKRENMDGDYK